MENNDILEELEVNSRPTGEMKFRSRFINQWPAIFALGEGFNWVDFTIILFGVEWERYAGRYFEMTFIFLGLGFGVHYYEEMEFTND